MTRKELREIQESYRKLAREYLTSDTTYAQITGFCWSLANEDYYNHHERGQRLWAFFQALEQEAELKKAPRCSCPSEEQLPSPYCTMFQDETDKIMNCFCEGCKYLQEVESDV